MANMSSDAGKFGRMFGPQQLGMDTMALYRMLMMSPMFQQMMTNASLQGNQLSQNMTQGLAQRGLTTSGIGTMANAMGKSAPGFFMQQARSGLFSTAMENAMQNLMARMQAVSGLEQQRRATPSFGTQLLGAGLGTFGQIFPHL